METETFSFLDSFDTLTLTEQQDISGGVIVTIAGVTVSITAAKLAGIVAGSYGLSYAIGKGWAHVVN